MEYTSGTRDWDDSSRPEDSQSSNDWRETIELLRLVQDGYVGARKQLEMAADVLSEREALVNERLHYALSETSGHRALCLVPYRVGVAGSPLGKITLGAPIRRPMSLPRKHQLRVRCFGRFELSCGSNTVSKWPSVRAKAVFQYLAARPREAVVKEVLMESLWPGCDPQSANNNLKAAVHGLRQLLGQILIDPGNPPPLLFIQGSYQINPDVDMWVDVEEFERHWATGRRLEKEGRVPEAIREFESAQTLYRGDYLQDELYEDWTMRRRETLKDTYVAILSKLASYAFVTKDHETCIICCHKILDKDDCCEDAYRWLMQCYSRLGQRNRALRWYEICSRTVKANLGVTPDPDTEGLHHRLLRNEII